MNNIRLRRNIKFDFIIYGSLIGASTLLIFGAKSYCASLSEYNGFTSEIKNAIKEMKGEETVNIPQNEKPEILNNINEKEIINNYLYSLLDGINTNETISSDMIKSWQNFEIINTNYLKEITTTYYSYSFDLKISNPNALLPVKKNEKLSTKDYTVITLIANISIKNNENLIKSIDIPQKN